HDLPAAVHDAMADAGLATGRVGVVGADSVSSVHWEALGGTSRELVPADGLLTELRMTKSPAEQDLLRAAGRVGGEAVVAAIEAGGAGASEQEAAGGAVAKAMARGAAVANAFTQISGPERPPRRRAFPAYADDAAPRAGDVFLIDLSGALDGYF